jgi:Bacterial Ig-like domain (group 2)
MLNGRKLAWTLVLAVLVTVAVGVGCRGFFTKSTLQSLAVGPATQTIQTGTTGNTQQFTAVGTYDTGQQIDSKVTWSVSPIGIVSISNTGLATAQASGQTTVTATSTEIPTIFGSTSLQVVPGGVTSIKVTPSFQSTKTGSTFELLAKDQSGNDISASVTWIFYLTQTTTQETGFTLGIPDQGGQPFTVGTLTPAVTTFPVTLDAVATLTTTSGTVTSIRIQVQITS